MIETERLVLRQWQESDRQPWRELNADPEVMRYFVSPLAAAQSDAMFERLRNRIAENGWGLWALEHDGTFLGFTGLAPQTFDAHFTPAVEIGWRLCRSAWGHGYATEAARAALAWAFTELSLDEVVSMTAVQNERSRAVMERLGMSRDAQDDFDHPNVPLGHPLRRHVLYRISLKFSTKK